MPRATKKAKLNLEERLINRCLMTAGGCWIWQGATHRSGYGVIHIGSLQDGTRRTAYVHCVAYELWVGPLAQGEEVTHTCDQRNIRCVNPHHLLAVPHDAVPRKRRPSHPHADEDGTLVMVAAEFPSLIAEEPDGVGPDRVEPNRVEMIETYAEIRQPR